MEKIIIEKTESGNAFNVFQGDRYADGLTFEEMLGIIAALTMQQQRPCIHWLRTKEEHEAWLNSFSTQSPKLEPWQKLIEKQ